MRLGSNQVLILQVLDATYHGEMREIASACDETYLDPPRSTFRNSVGGLKRRGLIASSGAYPFYDYKITDAGRDALLQWEADHGDAKS